MQIVQQSLADQIYTEIKNSILRGELSGGDKIREDELATQFGVSRTPVREALRRLSDYGLVCLAPRSHAAIAMISDKEALDIAELRIELEKFAIDHITPEVLEEKLPELSRYAAECTYAVTVGERGRSFEQDSLFHIALVECSGNAALIEVYRRLDARIQLLRVKQNLAAEGLIAYLNQHNELIAMLRTGRTEDAKNLITHHVLHGS